MSPQKLLLPVTLTAAIVGFLVVGVVAVTAAYTPIDEDYAAWQAQKAACDQVCLKLKDKQKVTDTEFEAAGWVATPSWLWFESTRKDGKVLRIYGCEWVNPRTGLTHGGRRYHWKQLFDKVDLVERFSVHPEDKEPDNAP